MKIIILLLFVFLASGLYFTLAGALRLPTLRTGRAMAGASKKKKAALSVIIDESLMSLTVKMARFIKINEYKRVRMDNTLKAANIDMTPEEYTAHAILKAGLFLLPIIPCFFIMPVLNIAFILLAVLTYFKENGKADQLLRDKKEMIEGELYRFTSTLTQELKNSRDVLSILERYKKNAGEEFKHELDVLCADMRSSSYEAALTRFESRLNSPQLSDVVRGLIGVLRGDDGAVYFQMLTHDFKQMELQRLKAKAAKIPPKIRVFSFVMLGCYVATFFVIIFYEIIGSMATMF